jgi:hypothetical protein
MPVAPTWTVMIMAASLAATLLPAHADGRAEFVTCQAMVDRLARSTSNAAAASTSQDDAELQRCRLIIRDWTLRESRMSVDENGRPLR